jgi:hypothetical protein
MGVDGGRMRRGVGEERCEMKRTYFETRKEINWKGRGNEKLRCLGFLSLIPEETQWRTCTFSLR